MSAPTPDEVKALIEKTRRIDGMWSKEQIAAHTNRLADALEAALPFLRPEPSEDERVSAEVLDEYHRIQQWLERQAALLGPVGDTMHGLAAEALARLIEREHSRHRIPLYGMLDIWQALYRTSHPEFDEFYAEHGYAETWARLCAEVRTRRPMPSREQVERWARQKFGVSNGTQVWVEFQGSAGDLADAVLALFATPGGDS